MTVTGKDHFRKVHPVPNTGFARAYLVEGSEGLMAIDVGSPGCAKDIARYITVVLGRPLDDLKYVTATHFHIDHIGGIGHLISACPAETRVLFNYMVKSYLSGTKKISLIKNWFVAFPSATMVSARYIRRFSHLGVESLTGIPLPGLRNIMRLPFSKDRIEYFGREGKQLDFLNVAGFEGWEIIQTPGHTEDSVCFFKRETGELISGDLIINISKDGRGELNRFHWNGTVTRESYKYLFRTIHPAVIYPGHGEVIRGGPDILSNVAVF